MQNIILGKSLAQWKKEYPIIEDITDLKEVVWINSKVCEAGKALQEIPIAFHDMMEAEKRWKRFAPLIKELFPLTEKTDGIIESELKPIDKMKKNMQDYYKQPFSGRLLLKCDSDLPVAGSIKARGGIYEVLKHAEDLALKHGMIKEEADYSVMAKQHFREFFSGFSLAVGSTGNLGLSIGIMGSALGFKVTVHMSSDAKQWKKDLLRSKGVNVIEYKSDYSKAVEEGRKQSYEDPNSYFVDDENSKDLFLGYSTAALRLKKQLDEHGINVNENQPLIVYLPCGVGGAPGGICFGLKQVFGDDVKCYFVEPTHSPCMLLGLITGQHERISVQDFGIDNVTEADGLAVGRPSGFVGKIMEGLISGIYTIQDKELYRLLALLWDSEEIKVEPSATPGLLGPTYLSKYKGMKFNENAVHLAWATGGLFVPDELMKSFYEKGKSLL